MSRYLLFFLIFLAVVAGKAQAQQKLVFAAFDDPHVTPAAVDILKRAYALLDIEIETVFLNPRRALLDSSSGKTDGEVIRIRQIGDSYDTLIRVDVPLFDAPVLAYASNPGFRKQTFDGLKATGGVRVGFVAGHIYAKNLSEGFAEVWIAEDPKQLMDMLKHDRIDLAIISEDVGNRAVEAQAFRKAFTLASPAGLISAYHYLHIRHAELVPRVEDALRATLPARDGEDTEDTDQDLLRKRKGTLRTRDAVALLGAKADMNGGIERAHSEIVISSSRHLQ